jgi:integrase
VATIRKRAWVSGGEERFAWVCYYGDHDGKRHIKTFKTQKAPKAWSNLTMHEISQGTHTPPSTSVTVLEAGEGWIKQAKADKLERATVDQYEQHLRLHIKPLLGGKKLASLRTDTITKFRNALTEGNVEIERKPCSPAMVKKILVSLGAILSDAMDKGLVAQNVCRAVISRRQRKQEARHKKRPEVGEDIPTTEELRAILAAARLPGPMQEPWPALMITVIFTGLRASELRGLRWGDVNLDQAELIVRQRADKYDDIGDPKSGAGKRTIPLAPLVVSTLREWRVACPKGELGLVFPDDNGNVLSLSTITDRGLGKIQQAAGLCTIRHKPKYRIHAFRHAAASLLIAGGHSAKWIQTFMGHSTISLTFDTYGHLMETDKDAQETVRGMQARVLG